MPKIYQPIEQEVITWTPTPNWGFLPASRRDAIKLGIPVYYSLTCGREHGMPRLTANTFCMGCHPITDSEKQSLRTVTIEKRNEFIAASKATNSAVVPIRYSSEVAEDLLRRSYSVGDVLA